MGPMSTAVQFSNEEQFNRYGYNVLYQAHAASMEFAVMATQFAANQNTMMPMINPMFRPQSNATAPAITAPEPYFLRAALLLDLRPEPYVLRAT